MAISWDVVGCRGIGYDLGLERGVILGCPGIPQDRLGHVGPYISGCHGISQDGSEHVGLGTLLRCISQDVLGYLGMG